MPGTYVFEPADLEEIASQVNASSGEEAVRQVSDLLIARGYPVKTDTDIEWVFNDGSGARGQVATLYLGATEYLLIAGAGGGEQWILGPYTTVEIHDYVLYGDLMAYAAGELNPPVLGPGDREVLAALQTQQYRTTNGVWLLEYGRGVIPAELYPAAFASDYPLLQSLVMYAGQSFVTAFVRNWVYEAMGLPGGMFSMLGML